MSPYTVCGGRPGTNSDFVYAVSACVHVHNITYSGRRHVGKHGYEPSGKSIIDLCFLNWYSDFLARLPLPTTSPTHLQNCMQTPVFLLV